MINSLLVIVGKFLSYFSRLFNLGHGSTWPGEIALSVNKNFIKEILNNNDKRLKTILIAGTNGKTTTGKLIQMMLETDGNKVFQNESGANLLNGIASSMLLRSNILCTLNYDYAIFETDENTLPLILKQIIPDYLLLLNLFRDQLDRYGEVNTIANKWQEALAKLPKKTTAIFNADDPQIAMLGKNIKGAVFYFGLEDKTLQLGKYQHGADSTYCPHCGTKLSYGATYFSHLGIWHCSKCKLKRPKVDQLLATFYPLPGVYNKYNTHAAILLAKILKIEQKTIDSALHEFSPAFGRQEALDFNGKKVQIFLSKNPTSFNESLRTVMEKGGRNLLFVLNDRIPDGRDVSWIWDTDIEQIDPKVSITISGDRAYDMGLRVKYAIQNSKIKIYEDLKEAIKKSLNELPSNETLYILPTYSAMLEVRKILTGKKIL